MADNSNSDKDLIIKIKFQIEKINQKFKKEVTGLKRHAFDLKNTIRSIKLDEFAMPKGMSKKNMLSQYNQQLAEVKSNIADLGLRRVEKILPKEQKITSARKRINKLGAGIKDVKQQFNMAALGIMFFGMALQRVFGGIWKTGQKTFQDVMHSVENTVTEFDRLDGSVKFLQFTIGQALEPIAYMLIPIIDRITEWISNNQKLFRLIVLIGSIIAATFMVGGTAWLGVDAMIGMFIKLKGVATKLIGLNFASVMAWFSNPVTAGLLAALALLVIVGAIAFKGLKEVPGSVERLKDQVSKLQKPWNTLKGTIEKVVNELIPGWKLNWTEVGILMEFYLSGMITSLGTVIYAVNAAIKGFVLLARVVKTSFDLLTNPLKTVLNSGSIIARLSRDVKDFGYSIGDTIVSGLEGMNDFSTMEFDDFRKKRIAEIALIDARANEASLMTPMTPQMSYAGQTSSPNIVVNVEQNINADVDSFKQVVDDGNNEALQSVIDTFNQLTNVSTDTNSTGGT